jgi:hypothetical protein
VKSTTAWWIAAGILIASTVVVARSPFGSSSYAVRPIGSGWVDADAPRRIRMLAAPIERIAHWPGLGDFLVANAWTESRGNSRAQNGSSGAVGWFQGFPSTLRADDLGIGRAQILADENLQVALQAWYAYRLRPYARSGQVIDWSAIRRGEAYPSLVDDTALTQQRSRDVQRRFEEGVDKAGLPAAFAHYPAFPPGFAWPGIDAVLGAVGRSRLA